jgi:exopolysaccharide production protein ExoQ
LLASAEGRQSAVLSALAVIAPVLGVFAPHGEAALLVVAAVALALCGGWRAVGAAVPRDIALLIAMLIAWAAITSLWSANPGRTLARAGQIAGLCAIGMYVVATALSLSAANTQRVRTAAIVGVVLAMTFLLEERLTLAFLVSRVKPEVVQESGSVTWWIFKPAITILSILVWVPVVAAVRRGQPLLAVLAVAAAAALAVVISGGTAMMALVAGALAYVLSRRFPARAAVGVVAALIFVGAAIVPWSAHAILAQPALIDPITAAARSFTHRLLIWDFVTTNILQHKLLGWALDASRAIPGGKDVIAGMGERLPLHPHNALLQLHLELGIPGLLIGVILAVRLCLRVGDGFDAIGRAGARAMVFAAICFAVASFSVWQSWWMSFQFIAAAIGAAALRPSRAPA